MSSEVPDPVSSDVSGITSFTKVSQYKNPSTVPTSIGRPCTPLWAKNSLKTKFKFYRAEQQMKLEQNHVED